MAEKTQGHFSNYLETFQRVYSYLLQKREDLYAIRGENFPSVLVSLPEVEIREDETIELSEKDYQTLERRLSSLNSQDYDLRSLIEALKGEELYIEPFRGPVDYETIRPDILLSACENGAARIGMITNPAQVHSLGEGMFMVIR